MNSAEKQMSEPRHMDQTKYVILLSIILVCVAYLYRINEPMRVPLESPTYRPIGEGVLISMDKLYYLYTEVYYLTDKSQVTVAEMCTSLGPNCVGYSIYQPDVKRFALSYQDENGRVLHMNEFDTALAWVPCPKRQEMEEWNTKQRPNPRVPSKVAYKGWDGWNAYFKVQYDEDGQ